MAIIVESDDIPLAALPFVKAAFNGATTAETLANVRTYLLDRLKDETAARLRAKKAREAAAASDTEVAGTW